MSDHAPPREDPQNSYLETRIREALQQGRERDAVRFAVTGYHGALKRFLRTRLDSDDEANEVLSELWVIVCQNVRSFRGEGTFLAFAQGIAAHCISAFLREKQQRRARFSADLPEAAAMPRSDTHPYQKSAVRGRLARILDGLSAQEQEVLELHLRQGLTWDEIGKKLALSGAILRRRHSRLLERLRQRFAEDAAACQAHIRNEQPETDRTLFAWLCAARDGEPVIDGAAPPRPERAAVVALRARIAEAEERAGLLPAERLAPPSDLGAHPRKRRRR